MDNLNCTPYDYTVKVTKKIQGIRSDRKSSWVTTDRGLWNFRKGSDQDHPQGKKKKKEKKKMQKDKICVWILLSNYWEKKGS